jgi:hypothetical protein
MVTRGPATWSPVVANMDTSRTVGEFQRRRIESHRSFQGNSVERQEVVDSHRPWTNKLPTASRLRRVPAHNHYC